MSDTPVFSHLEADGTPRMVDVGAKGETERTAVARAVVVMSAATLAALEAKALPKGDVLAVAQVAGIMAAKRTWELIPMCHPLALTHVAVRFAIRQTPPAVEIEAEASTVGRTGVEMEAILAAQVAAATIYDMCKAVQKDIVIEDVRLLRKSGGKSGLFVADATAATPPLEAASLPPFAIPGGAGRTAACITLSDKGFAGQREDTGGPALLARLQEALPLRWAQTFLLPDEPAPLRALVRQLAGQGCDLILTTGGTGLSPRDQTPEALLPLLTRRLHGLEQAMLAAGLAHTPRAAVSRCLAGALDRTLILALPGSRRGALENLDAVLPVLPHALDKLAGDPADCGRA